MVESACCRSSFLAWVALSLALALAPQASAGINDGLVAYYRFEGNTADSSGNGNLGAPSGSPGYATGHSGQAVSLDGVNDVVALPGNLWTTAFSTAF